MTSIFFLLARLLLFAVFAVAAAAKLTDREGFHKTLVEFGVPPRFTKAASLILPALEMMVAISLLCPAIWAWRGALVAAALLTAFTAVIVFQLMRERTPNCRCFGNLQSAPIGWQTVIRNVVFLCSAAAILGAGPDRLSIAPLGWVLDLSVKERFAVLGIVTALALAAGEAALLFGILRQQGRILLRLESMESALHMRKPVDETPIADAKEMRGLSIGSRAPDFVVHDTEGVGIFTLQTALADKVPALLLFTNPNCGPCQSLMPEIVRWQRELAWRLKIVLISEGSCEDNRTKLAAHGARNVFLQKRREVAEKFQAWGTPSSVLLNLDGTIGSGILEGADPIREFVMRTSARTAKVPQIAEANARGPVIQAGNIVPASKLQDIEGATISLTGNGMRKTLLVFWNPHCGFCQRMLSDIRAWEADPPTDAPELLFLSSGTIEENREMKLRSPIVLERSAEIASWFGATGTPMAVLINRLGRVESEVVAGAKAIFALVGAARETASV